MSDDSSAASSDRESKAHSLKADPDTTATYHASMDTSTAVRTGSGMLVLIDAASMHPAAEFAMKSSPYYSPIIWAIINSLCFLWSFLLFWDLIMLENHVQQKQGDELYWAWSFWTTIVWIVESGLSAFFHHYQNNSIRRIDRLVETISFFIAIYFLFETIQLHYSMQQPDFDGGIDGERADVGISAVVYLGALIYYLSIYYRRDSGEPDGCEREISCDLEHGPSCGYGTMQD